MTSYEPEYLLETFPFLYSALNMLVCTVKIVSIEKAGRRNTVQKSIQQISTMFTYLSFTQKICANICRHGIMKTMLNKTYNNALIVEIFKKFASTLLLQWFQHILPQSETNLPRATLARSHRIPCLNINLQLLFTHFSICYVFINQIYAGTAAAPATLWNSWQYLCSYHLFVKLRHNKSCEPC